MSDINNLYMAIKKIQNFAYDLRLSKSLILDIK